jgi:osmotically-inducible protein OsmY
MTIRPLFLISALIAAPLLTGCLAFQEKTLGESIDEGATGSQIKTTMFTDSAFKKFGEVKVEVAGRFVLLAGRVPSQADREEAEKIAWSARAVDEVANELVVEPRNLGRDVNDSWIREQIRGRLLADRNVKGVNYNVVVYDGAVYLLGLAQSEDELRRAAETASTIRGVTKVVSYVKMRDRRAAPILARPGTLTTAAAINQPADIQAQAPPNTISGEPQPNAPSTIATSALPPAASPSGAQPSNGQIRLAPIEDHAPTSRGAVYSDPYAKGRSNQLESSPK